MSSQRHKREIHGVDSAWQEDRRVLGTGYGGGVRVPDSPPFYPPPSSFGGGGIPSEGNPVTFGTPYTTQSGNVSVAFNFDASTSFTAPDTPLTFTIESGTLPSQLSIASGSGVISGTPDTVEDQVISVRCTDADGDFAVSNTFTISIAA